MGWTPPTEEEFNREWLLPKTALELISPAHENDGTATRRWITARLKAGLLVAVARTLEVRGIHKVFCPIGRNLFEEWDEWGSSHFWRTGDATFYPHDTKLRAFDVRIDPNNLSSGPPATPPPQPETVALPPPAPREKPPLSKNDAVKFCHAILAGWPESGQDFAYEKALLFFPENKIPRDWFRSILRSIRGPTKRGKKAKIDD